MVPAPPPTTSPSAGLHRRMRLACAVLALALLPASAFAQKAAFVDAFVAFHSSLIGTYGDEGPEIAAAVERMAVALEAWDREARQAEATLTSRGPGAAADLALLYLEWGRRDAALSAIDAAIRTEPMRAAFHRLRGRILDAAGRQDDAVAALTSAWTLDAGDHVAAYLLASRRAAEGAEDHDPQLATLRGAHPGGTAPGRPPRPFIELRLVEDRAADTPIFSPALYAEGLGLLADGRYADAIARFRAAMTRDPLVVNPSARSGRMAEGIAALRQGRVPDAVVHLEAAATAAPASSEARRILGSAYRANRDEAKSVDHLRAAVGLAPDDERAGVALGRALADAGRHEEAEQALRETISRLPASAEAYWALADLYEQTARGDAAIRELETAATFPVLAGKSHLYWRIAELSHRHQDYDRVAVALDRRARLMPNEPVAHKDAGLAYTRVGRPNSALVELLMAVLLGLEDAETFAAIGQVHLNAGRFADAEAVLLRAVALQPDLPQARYALGTALIRQGKNAEGREHLAEFQRLRTAALDSQRRSFEEGVRDSTPDPVGPEPGK